MRAFTVTAVLSFLLWLLLTAGDGDIGLMGVGMWSAEGLIFGIAVSCLAGFASHRFFCRIPGTRLANPGRWLAMIAYFFGPFLFALIKANLDVAYRIITGKIRPGIVRIKTDLGSDLEVLLLASSITLTPGTLTVDVDEKTNDMFIHWINVEEGQESLGTCDTGKVCGSFPKWARRIAG